MKTGVRTWYEYPLTEFIEMDSLGNTSINRYSVDDNRYMAKTSPGKSIYEKFNLFINFENSHIQENIIDMQAYIITRTENKDEYPKGIKFNYYDDSRIDDENFKTVQMADESGNLIKFDLLVDRNTTITQKTERDGIPLNIYDDYIILNNLDIEFDYDVDFVEATLSQEDPTPIKYTRNERSKLGLMIEVVNAEGKRVEKNSFSDFRLEISQKKEVLPTPGGDSPESGETGGENPDGGNPSGGDSGGGNPGGENPGDEGSDIEDDIEKIICEQDANGVIRYNLADSYAHLSKSMKLSITLGAIETGDYYVRIVSFASDDGLLDGNATIYDDDKFKIVCVGEMTGLKLDLENDNRIIYSEKGTDFKGNDNLRFELTADMSSISLTEAEIRLCMYKRDENFVTGEDGVTNYTKPTYQPVDFKYYFSNDLAGGERTSQEDASVTEWEYTLDQEIVSNSKFGFTAIIKDNVLQTGEYKMEFRLYSGDLRLQTSSITFIALKNRSI